MTQALLLSAYDASSHRRWREGLVRTFPDIDWTVKTLPPRHFKWRTRGNALWWGIEERDELDRPWDLVVAASTVDLGSLVGLLPRLGKARRVVYFHENQFEYPTRDGFDPNLGVRDVYTALAADAVLFNSAFNRDTLLAGIAMMAEKMPDYWPPALGDEVARRSSVIEVGLEGHWFEPRLSAPTGELQILWNHRWEYDKAPERFFAALRLLAAGDVGFRVHVVGEQFREAPPCFAKAKLELGDRIDTWGYVEDSEAYRALLRRCDVVVSTALHEFQGLAVLEAAASGCLPVVPDRLAYVELLPEYCRYESTPDSPERESGRLAEHLRHVAHRLEEIRRQPPIELTRLRWSQLEPAYRSAMLRG